jgi:hypothetical protein
VLPPHAIASLTWLNAAATWTAISYSSSVFMGRLSAFHVHHIAVSVDDERWVFNGG